MRTYGDYYVKIFAITLLPFDWNFYVSELGNCFIPLVYNSNILSMEVTANICRPPRMEGGDDDDAVVKIWSEEKIIKKKQKEEDETFFFVLGLVFFFLLLFLRQMGVEKKDRMTHPVTEGAGCCERSNIFRVLLLRCCSGS